jgi:septum formation protein
LGQNLNDDKTIDQATKPMTEKLILASGSPFRKAMLVNAGVDVEAVPADVDERALEGPLQDSGVSPEDVALVLAEAKATEVSERRPGALVLGCDQTLSLGDEVFHKPADMEGARRHLLALSGRTHQLNSAAVLVRDGKVLWRHVGIASMTMRKLDPAFIGRHLARVGAKALGSVGAYQIEGEGIQLFDKIEGDHFTIVGLPLLPLLAELRDLGAIDG